MHLLNILCIQPEENEENFKKDEKGRIYRFAPFSRNENFNEYKADANVVKPRYYLEFEQTRNESQWDQYENYIDEYFKEVRRMNRASNCSSIISECIREC